MITPNFSPAAQAVLDAFRPTSHHRMALAAALRAAVTATTKPLIDSQTGLAKPYCRPSDILAIANELDPLGCD